MWIPLSLRTSLQTRKAESQPHSSFCSVNLFSFIFLHLDQLSVEVWTCQLLSNHKPPSKQSTCSHPPHLSLNATHLKHSHSLRRNKTSRWNLLRPSPTSCVNLLLLEEAEMLYGLSRKTSHRTEHVKEAWRMDWWCSVVFLTGRYECSDTAIQLAKTI